MSPRVLAARVHRDYVQPERLGDFRALLGRAVELGYETMTLSAFARLAEAGDLAGRQRVLLVRHDVDSDLRRARRMSEIERELGIVGSYFFRRSTWDVEFMHELQSAGFEVGYHYEELATLVKQRGVSTAADARELIPPARERLGSALAELRAGSGLALDVVASHGDFANRAIGVSNVELLADRSFRARIGVRLEAYDVEAHVDARASDGAPRGFWQPMDPGAAVERGERVVEVLVHPRSWGAAPMTNLRIDVRRLLDGARFNLKRARARS